jgi:hypothetical protein
MIASTIFNVVSASVGGKTRRKPEDFMPIPQPGYRAQDGRARSSASMFETMKRLATAQNARSEIRGERL